MDILSHALWGGIALGRTRRRDYALACALGALPDVLGEGVMFTVAAVGGTLPTGAHGHPQITEFPLYLRNCYNATHSLVVLAGLFLAVCLLRRRPAWLLLAWALHIIVDIPTHALTLFPTPFLWPLSEARVDGIPWRSAWILIPNIALLILAYGAWYADGRRNPSAAWARTDSGPAQRP